MKDVAILLIMNKLSFERTREHSSLTQLLRVFPVKLAAIHIVRQPARLGARFFEEKVVPTLKSLFCSLNVAIYGHSGTPECDLRKQMAQYDFDSENLPRSLGGGWTYQDFTQWREQRLIVERTSTLQLNSDSPHVHETEPCHDEASPCLGTPLRGNSALSRVQLVPVLDRAQSGPERLLENELTDQVMNLTWQLYDPCDQSQLTDQTIMQLHKANRFQHEGGSGQMDSCAVEWLQGRPVANAQSLRSDAKTASDIGAGGHFLTTQRWSNGLVNSVPTGLNVTARRLDEGDPLISHGSMFPASNLNPQQKREHGAYMNLFPAAHNFNIFSSK